jgi:hypothetical protein
MDEGKFNLSDDGRSATFEWMEKTNGKFTIKKDGTGFIFYEIMIDAGKLPETLKGRFSSIDSAMRKLREHLRQSKPTPAARRDAVGREVQERMKAKADGAKASTKGRKQVRQGADH